MNKNNSEIIKNFKRKHMILIRGIPGSGKSTIAEMLSIAGYHHLEADMWFYNTYGWYNWSKEDSPKAHAWCQEEANLLASKGFNIVITNTFIKKSQMEPYINIAKQYKYKVTILVATNSFESIHNVPKETLETMRRDFEY